MSRRMERVNQLIRDELSQLIPNLMRDLGSEFMVSVTEVSTAADLGSAKVFISVLGTPEENRKVVEQLSAAAPAFRKALAGRLFIRKMPELLFRADDSIERGSKLLELLDKVADEESERPAKK